MAGAEHRSWADSNSPSNYSGAPFLINSIQQGETAPSQDRTRRLIPPKGFDRFTSPI